VELQLPGLIGAVIGLALGYVDFRVVSGVVEGRLRKLDRSQGLDEKAVFERKIRAMRVVFLIMTVGVFPVVGYLFGITIAGRG
jgi:hypothetical protein